MAKLYEIADEYRQALAEMTDAGFDEEIIEDSLACIKDDLEVKAVNVVKHTFNINSDIDALDAEIKRLTARKKTLLKQRDWIKYYLVENMTATGINRIECPEFTISTRKAPQICNVTDFESVPDKYKTEEVTVKIDKKKLLADLKIGSVEGAELKEGNIGVMIR